MTLVGKGISWRYHGHGDDSHDARGSSERFWGCGGDGKEPKGQLSNNTAGDGGREQRNFHEASHAAIRTEGSPT
jgi:hypothetical protein